MEVLLYILGYFFIGGLVLGLTFRILGPAEDAKDSGEICGYIVILWPLMVLSLICYAGYKLVMLGKNR